MATYHRVLRITNNVLLDAVLTPTLSLSPFSFPGPDRGRQGAVPDEEEVRGGDADDGVDAGGPGAGRQGQQLAQRHHRREETEEEVRPEWHRIGWGERRVNS